MSLGFRGTTPTSPGRVLYYYCYYYYYRYCYYYYYGIIIVTIAITIADGLTSYHRVLHNAGELWVGRGSKYR